MLLEKSSFHISKTSIQPDVSLEKTQKSNNDIRKKNTRDHRKKIQETTEKKIMKKLTFFKLWSLVQKKTVYFLHIFCIFFVYFVHIFCIFVYFLYIRFKLSCRNISRKFLHFS